MQWNRKNHIEQTAGFINAGSFGAPYTSKPRHMPDARNNAGLGRRLPPSGLRLHWTPDMTSSHEPRLTAALPKICWYLRRLVHPHKQKSAIDNATGQGIPGQYKSTKLGAAAPPYVLWEMMRLGFSIKPRGWPPSDQNMRCLLQWWEILPATIVDRLLLWEHEVCIANSTVLLLCSCCAVISGQAGTSYSVQL